jgi:hypothetical protein
VEEFKNGVDLPVVMKLEGDGRQESGAERLITRGGVTMCEEKTTREAAFGDAPVSGGSGEDLDALRDKCRNERDTMEPHETADCAGTDLAEAYENEDDGGS